MQTASPTQSTVAVFCGWGMATGLCLWHEWQRLLEFGRSSAGFLAWFTFWDPATTLMLGVLLLLPLLYFTGVRQTQRAAGGPSAAWMSSRMCSVLLALTCLLSSASIGFRQITVPAAPGLRQERQTAFWKLPYCYHDEFSYQLQARTFLAGRVAWPAADIADDAFHQIHVLNRPVTASRYFPWTGFWVMPFEALGMPILGHWVAGALSTLILHRVLLRLLRPQPALLGGLMIACSPGIAVFSNLLLSHHPTLLALSVFLWSFLRMQDNGRTLSAVIAGVALTCAMLGRPMTAAGFALPFGIRLGLILLQRPPEFVQRLSCVRVLAAFGVPLLCGFLLLGWMNTQLTGNGFRSAYQYYTQTWTPRHQYGFDNAITAEPESAVLESYNHWAVNLTPALAIRNVRERLIASAAWTLGLPALLLLLPAGILLACCRGCGSPLFLVVIAVVTLHLVHIPYWYDGILHWHYVFESAPLLLITAAAGLQQFSDTLRCRLSPLVRSSWLLMVPVASLVPALVDMPDIWGDSAVSRAVAEQSFSRVRQQLFRDLADSPIVQRPALILIDESAGDQQLSYVINSPTMDADVLVCRRPRSEAALAEIRGEYSDRIWYAFDPQTFVLQPMQSQ